MAVPQDGRTRPRYEGVEVRLPEKVEVVLQKVMGAAKEGLLALSVAVGLEVLRSMMEAEVTEIAGPRSIFLGSRHSTTVRKKGA